MHATWSIPLRSSNFNRRSALICDTAYSSDLHPMGVPSPLLRRLVRVKLRLYLKDFQTSNTTGVEQFGRWFKQQTVKFCNRSTSIQNLEYTQHPNNNGHTDKPSIPHVFDLIENRAAGFPRVLLHDLHSQRHWWYHFLSVNCMGCGTVAVTTCQNTLFFTLVFDISCLRPDKGLESSREYGWSIHSTNK